jgi:N-acetylglucosaminyldiphosphoundecaprenol N-acetyl-beta-D-mannosaminyltransferase
MTTQKIGDNLCKELPIVNFMGVHMHSSAMAETVNVILKRIEQNLFTQHVVVNVAKIVNMEKDPVLKESILSCDIINIDGMGVVFGARIMGISIPERVAGIDLFLELLKRAEEKRFPVFFLGARQEVVEETVRRIEQKHPKLHIAGFHHGYFGDDEKSIAEMIRKSGAYLLFVAITSPKKEKFIYKWKDQLGVSFVMGVGGSFDVISGKVKRAPTWMQKAGLEWAFRVIQEPRRMWKRYLVTNSKYAWMILRKGFNF